MGLICAAVDEDPDVQPDKLAIPARGPAFDMPSVLWQANQQLYRSTVTYYSVHDRLCLLPTNLDHPFGTGIHGSIYYTFNQIIRSTILYNCYSIIDKPLVQKYIHRVLEGSITFCGVVVAGQDPAVATVHLRVHQLADSWAGSIPRERGFQR